MNKAKDKLAKKQEEEKKEEETPADIALLTEIRDLLKNSDKAEEVAEKLADAK